MASKNEKFMLVFGTLFSVVRKMVKIIVKCVCGEVFQPEINLERYREDLEKSGLVPLLVPHKDHFVTVYVDKNGSVRGVERIILVEEDMTTQVASDDLDLNTIQQTALELEKEVDPNKDFTRYVSLLVFRIKSPEALFIAGETIGRRMWTKWREPILRLGAKYVPQLNLIIKSELKPILDKSGDANLQSDQEILITNCTAPQFVVGIAQGVLNAVSTAAKGDFSIKIEYLVEGNNVMLTVKN